MGCGGSKLPKEKRPHSVPRAAFNQKNKVARSVVSLHSNRVEILSSDSVENDSIPEERDFIFTKPKTITGNRAPSISNVSEIDLPGATRDTFETDALHSQTAAETPTERQFQTKVSAVKIEESAGSNELVNKIKEVEKLEPVGSPEVIQKNFKTVENNVKVDDVIDDGISIISSDVVSLPNARDTNIGEVNQKVVPHVEPNVDSKADVPVINVNETDDAKTDSRTTLQNITAEDDAELQDFFDTHIVELPEEDVFETDHELDCTEDHKVTEVSSDKCSKITEMNDEQNSVRNKEATLDQIERSTTPEILRDDDGTEIIPDGIIHEIESLNQIEMLPDTINDADHRDELEDSTRDFVRTHRQKSVENGLNDDSLISKEYSKLFPDDNVNMGNITSSEYRFICDEQEVLKEYNESLTELKEMDSNDYAQITDITVKPKVPKSIDSGIDDLYISELGT